MLNTIWLKKKMLNTTFFKIIKLKQQNKMEKPQKDIMKKIWNMNKAILKK